jgi:RHS repeat-associated protein
MSLITQRDHKYAYNGQEQLKDLEVNVTEMTWRQYDNALGRFHGVDKLAATTANMTPYHFAGNNPIVYSDPSGLTMQSWERNYRPYNLSGGGYVEMDWTNGSGGGGGGRNPYRTGGSYNSDSNGGLSSLGIMNIYKKSPEYTGDDPNGGTITTWTNDGAGAFHNSNIGVVDFSSGGHFLTLGEWGEMNGHVLDKIVIPAKGRSKGNASFSVSSGVALAADLTELTANVRSYIHNGSDYRSVSNALKNKQYYHNGSKYWQGKYAKAPVKDIAKYTSNLKYLKGFGKVAGVAGPLVSVYQIGDEFSNERYKAAGARAIVAGVAAGAVFIPGVGWGVAIGVGVIDAVWGDDFYNWLEE